MAAKSNASDVMPDDLLQQYDKTHRSQPPLDSLSLMALSVLADNADPAEARTVVDRLQKLYVNWNELRVTRRATLARQLEPLPDPDDRAERLIAMFNRLFDVCGAIDLYFLNDVKPGEGRKLLSDIAPSLSRDELSIVLFAHCPGATMPLSSEGLKEARTQNLVGRSGTKAHLQKALLETLAPADAARLAQHLELADGENTSTKTRGGGSKKKPAKKKAATGKASSSKKKKTTRKKK